MDTRVTPLSDLGAAIHSLGSSYEEKKQLPLFAKAGAVLKSLSKGIDTEALVPIYRELKLVERLTNGVTQKPNRELTRELYSKLRPVLITLRTQAHPRDTEGWALAQALDLYCACIQREKFFSEERAGILLKRMPFITTPYAGTGWTYLDLMHEVIERQITRTHLSP